MKVKTQKAKVLRSKSLSPAEKASLIRSATKITLKEYSKTFADLALYDRTEKARV